MDITCPHCEAVNDNPGSFCAACGKALPTAARTGPRVLSGADLAASSAGQSLQIDALSKQMRSAFRVLLWLGIFQTVVGVGLTIASSQAPVSSQAPSRGSDMLFFGIGASVVGIVFLALSAWARKNPLPAAVTGMVLFVSLWAMDIIAGMMAGDPAALVRGWLIKFIIIAALAKAISAGTKYRALRRQMQSDPVAGTITDQTRAAA